MQFLVQRWHSGKRGIRSHHHHRVPTFSQQSTRLSNPASHSTAHFQVGQPVSSQNFPLPHIPVLSNTHRFHSLDVTNNPIHNSPQHGGQVMTNSENRRPTTPTSPVDLGPWSGVTPPSKDQALRSKCSGNSGRHRSVCNLYE